MTDLSTRRALLNAGATGSGAAALMALSEAAAGASEAERAELSREFPANRLLHAEGLTPRALLALAALGSPKAVADALASQEVRQYPDDRSAALAEILAPTVADRDVAWGTALIETLANSWGNLVLAVAAVRAVKAAHHLAPESAAHLNWWLYAEVSGPERLAAHLRDHPEQWHQFWALFRVDSMGGNWQIIDERPAPRWAEAITELARDPQVRARLLDESLAALLRSFTPRSYTWYPRVHRGLEPTPAETLERWDTHVAVLSASASVAVGMSQDLLRAAVAAGVRPTREQVSALLAAPVFARKEKKLLTQQVALLADIVAAAPETASAVSLRLAEVVDTLPADVARKASALIKAGIPIEPEAPQAGLAPASEVAPVSDAAPVSVPAPRAADLPASAEAPARLDEDGLLAAVRAFLAGRGDGTLLPAMMTGLAGVDAAPSAVRGAEPWRRLAAGALEVAASDPAAVSAPRRALAQRLVAWLGLPLPDAPPRCGEIGGPMALLVDALAPGVLESDALRPLPAAGFAWTRTAHRAERGLFPSSRPEALRLLYRSDAMAAGPGASFAARAMDTSAIPAEFGLLSQQAREQDGQAQLGQWAAIVWGNNPDVLCAQAAPMLYTAVEVVNVRGVPALYAALGASRRVLGGPTALALGLACPPRRLRTGRPRPRRWRPWQRRTSSSPSCCPTTSPPC